MAAASDAIISTNVKTCRHCQGVSTRPGAFCSSACLNRSRADHTPQTLMLRFWAKVDKSPGFGPDGECWQWTARTDGRGYGEIKVAGIYRKAHRISLFGLDGLQDPRFACHRCDNPKCVRPGHLFAGAAIDNVHDMIGKGRRASLKGRTYRKKGV